MKLWNYWNYLLKTNEIIELQITAVLQIKVLQLSQKLIE